MSTITERFQKYIKMLKELNLSIGETFKLSKNSRIPKYDNVIFTFTSYGLAVVKPQKKSLEITRDDLNSLFVSIITGHIEIEKLHVYTLGEELYYPFYNNEGKISFASVCFNYTPWVLLYAEEGLLINSSDYTYFSIEELTKRVEKNLNRVKERALSKIEVLE